MGGDLLRLPDWDRRMIEAVKAAHGKPFRWGQHDCALFAADVVLAITGVDLAKGYRGTYTSKLGAARALRTRSLSRDVTRLLGEPISPTAARRGDVVAFKCDGWALGVVVGDRAAAAGRKGVTYIPMRDWRMAWSVGDG